MGRSLPRCPGLRGPRPAWTGQGTSHPAPGPSSPQPAGPLHPAGPERVHWGHLARKGSGQLPAKAQHRLGSSGCSRGIHCPQWPHGYHERHRSPGKAPSWGVTDRRDGFRRADCRGWGRLFLLPPKEPFFLHKPCPISQDNAHRVLPTGEATQIPCRFSKLCLPGRTTRVSVRRGRGAPEGRPRWEKPAGKGQDPSLCTLHAAVNSPRGSAADPRLAVTYDTLIVFP